MRDLAAATAVPEATPAKRRGLWTTYFLDASNNNGTIDWRRVARDAHRTGITGTELKATEGASFVDGRFADWRDECAAAGLRVMPYHFARPDVNAGERGAIREAEHFCRVVGEIRQFEWRPMLDFEAAPFDPAWARTWNQHVRARLGVAPTFYSYWAAIAAMHLREPLGDGLVLAFPNGQPRTAPCPAPWRKWTAHQYSWHGRVAGVSGQVDLNWTPAVRTLLAYPVRGAIYEPVMRLRRRRA